MPRCDACGAYLVAPATGHASPARGGGKRDAASGRAPAPAAGSRWVYLVVGLLVGGGVGYALHSAVGPREHGGAPTGPSGVMAGGGGGMGSEMPGGAPGGAPQMPAEVTAAVQRYRQALMADPNDKDANIGLGNLLFDSGQYEKAVDHYSRALEKDPANADVRVDRAIAYHGLGQDPKAAEELLRVTRERPDHANAWLNLGVVSAGMGDRATAIRAWEQYLKIDPNGTHAAAIKDELSALKKAS
ncbi:MAG TPA: tetratricopeptide repeat protein [Candidatus Limnocylindrales bacterium]|nr:tetratricopeptide repeat protein [Candidatus Limnocylindrales bacterium]